MGQSRGQVVGGQFFTADFEQEGLGGFNLGELDGGGCGRGRFVRPLFIIQEWVLQPVPLRQIQFRNLFGNVTHPLEIFGPFRDANRAPRIQHIKQVGTFQVVIMGRIDQSGRDTPFGFPFINFIHRLERVNIGHIEIIFTMFDFRFQQGIPVHDPCAILHLPYAPCLLQRQHDAIQAVGNFHAHRIKVDPTRLLEVGKLGDLLTIQPHFPTQPPRPQGRAFPVILYKPDVVFTRVNADSFQAFQVKLLGIAGVWFEDDLELIMLLHPVGVVTKTAIIGANAGFNVDDVPRFRPQHTQNGGRVHRSCPHLHIIRLPHQTTLRPPIIE